MRARWSMSSLAAAFNRNGWIRGCGRDTLSFSRKGDEMKTDVWTEDLQIKKERKPSLRRKQLFLSRPHPNFLMVGGGNNDKITMSCHFIKTTSRQSSYLFLQSEVRPSKFSWHFRGLGEARPRAGRPLVVALSHVVVCRNWPFQVGSRVKFEEMPDQWMCWERIKQNPK